MMYACFFLFFFSVATFSVVMDTMIVNEMDEDQVINVCLQLDTPSLGQLFTQISIQAEGAL